MKYSKRKKQLLWGVAAATVLTAHPALAQSTDAEAAADNTEANETGDVIVVLGTAASRISNFESPTPVTSISAEQLEQKAIFRVGDLISDIPAFAANQNLGRSSAPVGSSSFDLRSLGPARTLLLLDGRRVAATEPTGSFDTNLIPSALIEQVEVVTGGASSAYGSDAVAGVVSIELDHDYEGLKGDIQYGISTYDDVETVAGSLVFGRGFGRMHVVGALDYYDNQGQSFQSTRPWGDDSYALVTNPDGPPTRLRVPNARFSQLTYGGVSALRNPAALRGIQFGPGGTVEPFRYGTAVGTTYMIGGDGGSLADQANIFPEISRASAFGRVTFDIGDNTQVFADALYADVDIFSDGTTATNRGNLAIDIDNPYLPGAVRDIMLTEGVDTFYMGRIGGEEGAFFNTVDNKVGRFAIGAEGLVFSDWDWDIVAQFSTNEYYREDGNNRNVSRFALGVDAVRNPASGDIVCRAQLENPGSTDPDIANCVPINVFGAGSISDEAIAYYGGAAILDSRQEQTLLAANLTGSPFETWAGDVSIAVGAEYRKDSIDAESDPLSQERGWITVNPQPLSGEVDVREAYAEVVVPLLSDQPGGYLLDVNAAVRLTDYSTSGSATTWKVGVNYAPYPDLRFRGTLSHDIRAPSVNELFSGQNQFLTNLVDPRDNSNPTVTQLTGGNPGLSPEVSDAWTAGVIYTPGGLPGLRIAFDYYSFEIEDAISSLDGQAIIEGCYVRMQNSLCDAITLDGAGLISEVQATLLNAAEATTKGFDIEVRYTTDLGNGEIDFRLFSNHVNELTTTINGATTEYVDQLGSASSGGLPAWRHVASVQYSQGGFSGGVAARYLSGGNYRNGYESGVDIDDNNIPSITYIDLNMSQQLTDGFEIYGRIENLFNEAPPLAPSPISSPTYNGNWYHDRIGRYFRIGARVEF